jgi:hypothetical protein
MQIVIHTSYGTWLVQPEKEADLIAWLEQNAVKAGQRPLREQTGDSNYTGRQLLSEDFGKEF